MNSFTESREPELGGGGIMAPLQHFMQYMQKCCRKILIKNQYKSKYRKTREYILNKWISFNKIHVFHLNLLFCDCLL